MELTAANLRDRVIYDPETGEMTWRKTKNWRVQAGKRVGYLCATQGYWMTMLDDRMYSQHRLAWLYMTGNWPKGQIDHINHDRADNRWANLRDVSQAVNLQNRSGPCRGRKYQLPRGVEYLRGPGRVKRYRAVVTAYGKRYRGSYYMTAKEAEAEAVALRRKHMPGSTL